MFGDVDGELLCIPFKTTADGRTKCAWPDCVSEAARLYCKYIQRPWRECQLLEIEPAQTQGKREADRLDGLADEWQASNRRQPLVGLHEAALPLRDAFSAAEFTAGNKPPRLNPRSPPSQDAPRSAAWFGSGVDEMTWGGRRRGRRLKPIERAMAGVSRGSLSALLEAACSSPTASHHIPSLAVVFHAVANSADVEGRSADSSLLPALVAAAHESEPLLQALEDHQPCDVRAGAVVRWNGGLHQLLPGLVGRPIAAIDELGLLAHAIDPVLVERRGYGLGDLIELVLRRMNHIAGVLSAAWPSDDVPEPGSPVYISDNEFGAAGHLEDISAQAGACEAPDRAREALRAHSVSPHRLACRLDDPVSVFADTICLRFGADVWVPVPGGLLLEALIACGVRLAEFASRLGSDVETRWRSLVSDHVGCTLAGSAHPITGPVAVSPTSEARDAWHD